MSFNQKNNKGAKNFALCLSDCLFPNWSSVSFFVRWMLLFLCMSLELYLSIFLTPFLTFSFSKSWILYKSTCVATTSSSLHFQLICEKRSATAAQRHLVRTQAPKQRNLPKMYINLIVLFRLSGRYMSPVFLASISSLFASDLVTHWYKAKQDLRRNVVKRQWFDAQITRLLYLNHWWTQKIILVVTHPQGGSSSTMFRG